MRLERIERWIDLIRSKAGMEHAIRKGETPSIFYPSLDDIANEMEAFVDALKDERKES